MDAAEEQDDLGEMYADFTETGAVLAQEQTERVLKALSLRRALEDARHGYWRDYPDTTSRDMMVHPSFSGVESYAKEMGRNASWIVKLYASVAPLRNDAVRTLAVVGRDKATLEQVLAVAQVCIAWAEDLNRRILDKHEKRMRRAPARWLFNLRTWLARKVAP